jgi:hypothetical protein
MRRSGKHPHAPRQPAADDVRNQEVVRANRELAAYFKGKRTEREARAALKIIKAFIRHRERTDPAQRQALPAARSPKAVSRDAERHLADSAGKGRRGKASGPVSLHRPSPAPAVTGPSVADPITDE